METATLDLTAEFDLRRRELTGYCYRMLGSGAEAEDAVQETILRAWKAADRFEGRSSVRTWLYRIASNVCIDMGRAPQRRARPMDLGGPSTLATAQLVPLPESTFVQPIADRRVIDVDGDPAEVAVARDSIRLAFVAALQHLAPRQRAVLILCEVLKWQASEVAPLLDTSVASVNSALQRARATLTSLDIEALDPTLDPEHEALLGRYVDAFERYDMGALAELLRRRGDLHAAPRPVAEGRRPGHRVDVRPRARMRRVQADPCRRQRHGGVRELPTGRRRRLGPFALQVIDVVDGEITGHHNFLYPELFADFGLPPFLTD